jgi:hypothetical protein
MLVIEGGTRTPIILTRMPRLDAMPDADALDARIDDIFNAEWLADDERGALVDAGSRWYPEHAWHAIHDLAIHYGAERRTIAGMLAAMSAGYSWPDSLAHIGILFEERQPGQRASKEDPVPGIAAPYGWMAIAQAEAIRDGADPDVILRRVKPNGKTRTDTVKRWNFFHALLDDSTRVTIDVHMARGLTGGFIDSTPSSERTYRLLADAVTRAAERHDYTPADMQAILWTLIRGEAH